MPTFTYATRRSALALAQCRAFIDQVRSHHAGTEFSELQVVTSGDRIQDRPLYEVGGKGLFVKEIEEALLEKRADLAVHSIKDVPSALPSGLAIVCIPKREDPHDVLIAPRYKSFADLPQGAKVGTSSLRRQISLRSARPDLTFLPLRGNIDTRIRKAEEGEYDAIVLARAGLIRLGLLDRTTEILSAEVSLPAVGQGALGIETRDSDETAKALLAPVNHLETSLCVAAERGVLKALEGDCRTPLAAYAVRAGDSMWLRGSVAREDGSRNTARERRASFPKSWDEAERLGLDLGTELKALRDQ